MSAPASLLLLAYVLLAVLLLSLNLRARWHWGIKAGAVVLTTGFYFATWFGLAGMAGWPSSAPPPEGAELLAFEVRQPDKRGTDRGRVYLWLREAGGAPRAHELAYSEALHRELMAAGQGLASGRRQAVARRAGSRPADGRGEGLRFRELQAPGLPAKAVE